MWENITDRLALEISDFEAIKKARRKRLKKRLWRVFKILSLSYLLIFTVFLLLELGHINSLLKNTYQGVIKSKEAAKNFINKDFFLAKSLSQDASEHFAQSLEKSRKMNHSPLSYLPIASSQLKELEHLMTAISLLSRAGNQGIGLVSEINLLLSENNSNSYQELSREEKRALLKKLYLSAPELNGLKSLTKLAKNELDQLKLHGILWPVKYKIIDFKEQLALASEALEQAVPLSELLPILAGYPQASNHLLLLQNADELRPTGGFIGTYGIMRTRDGDIEELATHDIYHIDMPSEKLLKVEPPAPIKLHLNPSWYMRDANWSPDWPTSAGKLEWFYHQENANLSGKNDINNFDGVFDTKIAINPRFISRLLQLVGPIIINNKTYEAENFMATLEYQVEQGYAKENISDWNRKAVIGEIMKELKIKLLNLPTRQLPELLAIFNQALLNKELLFNFNNQAAQEISRENNWSGDLRNTDGDYLMWVDANFASLKSDAVINRSLAYHLKETNTGLEATLDITYEHSGQKKDWRTDRYKTYSRLYVPLGSRLLKINGAATKPEIYQENGKTVFGALIYVELDSKKTISLTYLLPDKLRENFKNGNYSLYWQKQPSARISKAQVDLSWPLGLKSINPEPSGFSEKKGLISWNVDLTQDRQFWLNF